MRKAAEKNAGVDIVDKDEEKPQAADEQKVPSDNDDWDSEKDLPAEQRTKTQNQIKPVEQPVAS